MDGQLLSTTIVAMDTDVGNCANYNISQSVTSSASVSSEIDVTPKDGDNDKCVPPVEITSELIKDPDSLEHSVEELMQFAEILYKCTLCTSLPSILTSKDSFLSHINDQHLASSHYSKKCRLCHLHFGTKEDLRSHLDCAHAVSDIDMLSSDDWNSKSDDDQTSTDDSCFGSGQNTIAKMENKQNFTVSHMANEFYGGIKSPVAELDKQEVLNDNSLQKEVKMIVSEASDNKDDKNTSLHSSTNISRLQQLTDQILSQDTVGNAGTQIVPLSLTPSFTPEFGKYTKLVREGGNIVYFCQVCNWKSQAKATFSVHCGTTQHTSKVKNADLNPNTHGTIPTKLCEKKYQEPVSWSHRGTLSFLADTAGYFINNKQQQKLDSGREDWLAKLKDSDVKPLAKKQLPMSDLIRSFNRRSDFNSTMNYRYQSDVVTETTDDSALKENGGKMDKSEVKNLVKDGKSLNKFKHNKRKGPTLISVRNREENCEHWSESDSNSSSGIQEYNSISVGPSQMSQRIDCKKRLLETITSPILEGKQIVENEENRYRYAMCAKQPNGNRMKSLDEHKPDNFMGKMTDWKNDSRDTGKPDNSWLSVWENQGQIDPVFLHHLNVLSNVNNSSEKYSLEKVKIKEEPLENTVLKCSSCDFSFTKLADYKHHMDTEHESEMANDASGEGGKALPGESAKMQKIKDTLKDLLCISPKGNVARELLLQKVGMILQMPEVMQWGPACNKAVRWEFPNSLAQRKGKYKKTYFFGVSLVEQNQEQEEYSDGENVMYQPLRDMSLDLEKLLEHLPKIVYWTGDLQAGVARDEVLELLHEKIEESDVQHWGVQCNRAMRLLFPDIQMKRKGKFKTTVFFGIDFMKNLEKRSFIPNKRGRPRKISDPDTFLSLERASEEILTETRIQHVGENVLQMNMSSACNWMEAMQNYWDGDPASVRWRQSEKELHRNLPFGNNMSVVDQRENPHLPPKNFATPKFQPQSHAILDITKHTINHLPSCTPNHSHERDKSISSSTIVELEKGVFENNNLPLSVGQLEGNNEYPLVLPKHWNKGREFSSSPPTRRWEVECENDGDDEGDTYSDNEQKLKRRKCEKIDGTLDDLKLDSFSDIK